MSRYRAVGRRSAFFDVIRGRRTCRNFASRPVEEAAVEKMLYAGSRAPAAGNRSTRIFLVVEDLKLLRMISAHRRDRCLFDKKSCASHPMRAVVMMGSSILEAFGVSAERKHLS